MVTKNQEEAENTFSNCWKKEVDRQTLEDLALTAATALTGFLLQKYTNYEATAYVCYGLSIFSAYGAYCSHPLKNMF